MTIEPISDERLAEIRAGLEGVTPGPWTVEADEREYRGGTEIVGYDILATGRAVVGCEGIDGGQEKDAAHIARLDPQTVSALLARLDKAEAGWQPISTAPTYRGARVIGWCTYPAGAEARIIENVPPYLSDPDAVRWDYSGVEQTVTHWRPLPPNPTA